MIHIFGDSFSDNLWPHILTEKTGIKHTNYSKTGETNQFILTTLIENLHNFKKGDQIIVQLSGQGRLNVKNRIIYGNEVDDGLQKHHEGHFSPSECDIIEKWYTTFFLPQNVVRDPYIDSIIHLSNHLSSHFNVILWNLTSLGSFTNKNLNDNVSTSPEIPHSELWLDLSEGGKKGWVEIISERKLGFGRFDPHPTEMGNIFIADQMINRIKSII